LLKKASEAGRTGPVGDRIALRLGRRDMNVFRTIDEEGKVPVVHVAGRQVAALCPACSRPSVTTNGCGWRNVYDVVRTLVVVLSICVRRFLCEYEDCPQRSFDERFEGIDRGGASERALAFFADMARGRATVAVARDLGVPEHYLRRAVGVQRQAANLARPRRLGDHLAIDECSVRKGQVFATVFSDPGRGVVLEVAPGRDGAAVWAFAGLYSFRERARVKVVTMDCHAPYRAMVKAAFPHAVIVADAFHLHRRVGQALAEVRRAAWNRARSTKGRRNADARAIKTARYALARARDELAADHSSTGERQRRAVAAACALDADLKTAYELKEAFRAAMAYAKTGEAELFAAALDLFDALCRGSGLRPFATLARTFRSWRSEILAYATTGGATNAWAEAINHLIKNQKRQAHGYKSWYGFRSQMLWCFATEVVDPDTGEILPLRLIPHGQGPRHQAA
jgi:transposase